MLFILHTTMLSLARPFNTIPAQISLTSQNHHAHSLILSPMKCSNNNSNDETGNNGGNGNTSTPVDIRFRRRASRRRRKQEQNGAADRQPMKGRQAAASKDWDSMTLTEKAIELYMGEKGLLLWLNKFAYASIFIIIGGWIMFRFVGPALNIYQLDTPPLSPTSIFKGS